VFPITKRGRITFFLFLLTLLILSEVEGSMPLKSPLPLPGLLPPEQIGTPRTIKREPQKALEEFKNALELFWNGRYDEALNGFDKVIKADLYALEPYYWKGIIYLRKGLIEEAKKMFQYYLEVKPAELRAIRALDRAKKISFPVLNLPEALYPKSHRAVNPFVGLREKRGFFESLKVHLFFPIYNPSAIAIGPDENLYIADFGSGSILIISREGIPIGSWRGLKNPSGIAISLDGRVYVSDFSESKILVFDLSGKLIMTFGEGEILNPQGINIDPYGYIYVCDWGNHRICKYTLDGKLVRTIGEGYLWEPLAVCIDDRGDIWVSDGNERCIYKFGWDGLFKGKLLEDVFSRGLFVDFRSRIGVIDEERKSLFLIDKDKVVEKINLSKLSSPSSISNDSFGNLFLTDFDNISLYRIDTPFLSENIEIRISKINQKEDSEREVEIEVSQGWYPLPLERIGLSSRIIEDDWIIEPNSVEEIDKPLIIGVIIDPNFEGEGEDLLNLLKNKLPVVDRGFVKGAFTSPELPPNRWKWERNKEPFDGVRLLQNVIEALVAKDARRIIIYCGKPPNIQEEEMRRLAYFARLHQIRVILLTDDEPPPLWESLIAYTGGRVWRIQYLNSEMPVTQLLRRHPFESYKISYTSISPEKKGSGKRYLRVFIETPFAHYEDEVTYYIWGEPDKILR